MTGDPAAVISAAVRAAITAGDTSAIAAALTCVEPGRLAAFYHDSLRSDVGASPSVAGLPASPGAASGRIALTADAAMAASERGEHVILVRPETTPDDLLGMRAAQGILTMRGGLASHAAVVARGWGIPAVVGAADIHIGTSSITIGETVLPAGAEITIDGSTGNVFIGALATVGSDAPPELDILLRWADAVAAGHVEVRANADSHGDAKAARDHGARGIGLCRTEHMFLAADRLPIMRRFILGDDPHTEADALTDLEHAQVADFEGVLTAMDGMPVTVRLLDPPLHEFLPDVIDLSVREAKGQLDAEGLSDLAAVRRLHEANPMLGTRGVRLGFVRSGVYEMQVRALCTAVANVFDRGLRPHVEIMIPLVVDAAELRIARSWVTAVLDEIGHPELASDVITVGAMIETPRAALTAGALAEHADFFSFGTNDLTQLTYAFSRDDVESRLLPAYLAQGILPANPFAELDVAGVGELLRIACEAARAAKPTIKLGACGEHAGDPASVDFLVRLGVDSVSCSPFRVPLARLGVAQALLGSGRVEIIDVDFQLGSTPADEPIDQPATEPADVAIDQPAMQPADEPADVALDEPADIAPTPHDVDESILLHVLRVRGFVTRLGFVASTGACPDDLLTSLVERGLVRHLEARDMYGLLPPGKERHAALLDSFATPEIGMGLRSPYARFLELNDEFKQVCTNWQIRDGAPNDHTDAAYDRACVDHLQRIAAAVQPVIAEMANVVARLGRYHERLTAAARCVDAGDPSKFTGVMCESFHDVWMELHEDLIALQRIDRVAEGSF
jgi:phosphoenolpyruvate-protein kinase (PTS system EI component)